MEIRRIDSNSEFLELENSWNTLLVDASHSVFATWDWVWLWWKHFGNNHRLAIVVAEEGQEVIGVAPLMYSVEKMFGLQRGNLEFIGTPHSDYNNFILNAENSQNTNCLNNLLSYLDKLPEKWLSLKLKDVPESAPCLHTLEKIAPVKQSSKCSYLPLPESYEAFLKSLSYKQRGNVNNTLNKIKKSFNAKLVDYSSPALCEEGLNVLIELHQKRWAAAGLTGAFADPTVRAFHFDAARTFAEKNRLGLYLLMFDGKPVSGSYGFKYNSKYYAYLPGFDPEYGKFGVGSILVPYLVNQFITEGLTEFDLMRGDEGYKERWNAIPRWNYAVEIQRKSRTGKLKHWFYDGYWHQGYRVKYVLNCLQNKSGLKQVQTRS
jgi:CelD/BcsL family acetyltransferase involved in cellulose biosynthesis